MTPDVVVGRRDGAGRGEVVRESRRVPTDQLLASPDDLLRVLRLDGRAKERRLDLLDDLVAERVLVAERREDLRSLLPLLRLEELHPLRVDLVGRRGRLVVLAARGRRPDRQAMTRRAAVDLGEVHRRRPRRERGELPEVDGLDRVREHRRPRLDRREEEDLPVVAALLPVVRTRLRLLQDLEPRGERVFDEDVLEVARRGDRHADQEALARRRALAALRLDAGPGRRVKDLVAGLDR